MKSFYILLFGLFIVPFLLGQNYKDISWPYGGVPDLHRRDTSLAKAPLNFGAVNIHSGRFKKTADFRKAFGRESFFIDSSIFLKKVTFMKSIFEGPFQMHHIRFYDDVSFVNARMDSLFLLQNCYFQYDLSLNRGEFSGPVLLNQIQVSGDFKAIASTFKKESIVSHSHFAHDFIMHNGVFLDHLVLEDNIFESRLDFRIKIARKQVTIKNLEVKKEFYCLGARFVDTVFLKETAFRSEVIFNSCRFEKPLIFSEVSHPRQLDLRRSEFYNNLDLRGIDTVGANLEGALISGALLAGYKKPQRLDLTRTRFSDEARIVLYDLAHLNLQPDKIRFVTIAPELSYSLKWSIIDELKSTVFKDNKKVKFELDYILAKSSMYQDKADITSSGKWQIVKKIPQYFMATIYEWGMGLGYRPFRLFAWMLLFMVLYAVLYFYKYKFEINDYLFQARAKEINREEQFIHDRVHVIDSMINCLYFSCLIFCSLRLKSDILLHFTGRRRWLILLEWLSGLIAYVSFLLFSKSGSILNTLSDLIFG